MRGLIVENWAPSWAQSPETAQLPGGEAGGPSPAPESGSDALEGAEALLALAKVRRLPRPRSAAPFTAGRARPGPRPQSNCHGVTRHVKGMWNAQLWLSGQARQEHVGGFPTIKAAAVAHDLAALVIKGPLAKTNIPKARLDGLWEDLKGKDWPTLRKAIKAIVETKAIMENPGLNVPETASLIWSPGPGGPLPVPTPRVGSKRRSGEMMMPPNLPPAMRAHLEGSPEPLTSGLTGMFNALSAGEGEGSPAANVRKSGRVREVSGRLIALNGEDPKLLDAPRRRRKRAASVDGW